MSESVELSFFDGKSFMLTAVDESKTFGRIPYADEDSNGIAFTLDGVTYAAIENPSDGYRSSIEKVAVLPPGTPMSTIIPPHKVTGRIIGELKEESYNRECDIVELVDDVTGKVVIAFGTDNTVDYYPSFIGAFNPKNLAANAKAAI